MAAFLVPNFFPAPVPAVANEDDPTLAEITAFCTAIIQFTTAADPTLNISNPTHGFALVLPNNLANNADVDACIAWLD